MITIEQRGDHVIDLKIIGRSPERAQRLIKEFEEQKYSIQKIHNHDIHLFTEQDVCIQNFNEYFCLKVIFI
jgi:hypothetical protein